MVQEIPLATQMPGPGSCIDTQGLRIDSDIVHVYSKDKHDILKSRQQVWEKIQDPGCWKGNQGLRHRLQFGWDWSLKVNVLLTGLPLERL